MSVASGWWPFSKLKIAQVLDMKPALSINCQAPGKPRFGWQMVLQSSCSLVKQRCWGIKSHQHIPKWGFPKIGPKSSIFCNRVFHEKHYPAMNHLWNPPNCARHQGRKRPKTVPWHTALAFGEPRVVAGKWMVIPSKYWAQQVLTFNPIEYDLYTHYIELLNIKT